MTKRRARTAGDDVYIGGVPAYSTLGWFDDPILSTFVRYPDTEFARLVFHELAHQVVYVKDDTVFNESFAAAVEEAGIRRWIATQPAARDAERLEADRSERLRGVFRQLVRETRARLTAIYASNATDSVKREDKIAAFAAMRDAYERAKAGDPSLARFRSLVRRRRRQQYVAAGRAVGLLLELNSIVTGSSRPRWVATIVRNTASVSGSSTVGGIAATWVGRTVTITASASMAPSPTAESGARHERAPQRGTRIHDGKHGDGQQRDGQLSQYPLQDWGPSDERNALTGVFGDHDRWSP